MLWLLNSFWTHLSSAVSAFTSSTDSSARFYLNKVSDFQNTNSGLIHKCLCVCVPLQTFLKEFVMFQSHIKADRYVWVCFKLTGVCFKLTGVCGCVF